MMTEIPATLPVFVIKEGVLFPFMLMGIAAPNEKIFANLLRAAESTGNYIVVVAEKHHGEDKSLLPRIVSMENIYPVGTVAAVVRENAGENGRGNILLKGLKKVAIKGVLFNPVFDMSFARVEVVEENNFIEAKDEMLLRSAVIDTRELFNAIGSLNAFPPAVLKDFKNINDPARLAEFVASNFLRNTEEL